MSDEGERRGPEPVEAGTRRAAGMRARMVVRITPADVGRRVSVRARWHGPEAATVDVVGTLDEWRDGTLRITPRDGRPRTVAEHDLLAGRVVPPPPAPRGRRGGT